MYVVSTQVFIYVIGMTSLPSAPFSTPSLSGIESLKRADADKCIMDVAIPMPRVFSPRHSSRATNRPSFRRKSHSAAPRHH